jgi:hypothetical protein
MGAPAFNPDGFRPAQKLQLDGLSGHAVLPQIRNGHVLSLSLLRIRALELADEWLVSERFASRRSKRFRFVD